MRQQTKKSRVQLMFGAFAAAMATASALIATPLSSAPPRATRDCLAADHMSLVGCIEGEAARYRAEGRWRIDPGMVIWNGSPVVVIDSGVAR
jgi:hypothetical protein